MNSFHIWHKWPPAWEGVSYVMTFDLDLFLQGYSIVTLPILWIVYIYVTQIQSIRGRCVMYHFHVNRSKVKVTRVIQFFIRLSLDGTYYGMALSVRPSVRSSVRPTVSTKKHRCKWRIFFKFCTQVCLGVPSINLLYVLSYLIKYAHNSIISDFSIFGIHRVIF